MASLKCIELNTSSENLIYLSCTLRQNLFNLDPWHYTGTFKYHSDSKSKAFIDLCKITPITDYCWMDKIC